MSDSESAIVLLVSNDGAEFAVNRNTIEQLSGFVEGALLGDDAAGSDATQISVPLVDSANLARIAAFANHYENEPMRDFAKPLSNADLALLVQPFYADFITELNGTQIFDLTKAAQFMDMRPLFDLCCARIASFIRGKTPEMIREKLEIPADFTAEEEQVVRNENEWVHDRCTK